MKIDEMHDTKLKQYLKRLLEKTTVGIEIITNGGEWRMSIEAVTTSVLSKSPYF